MQFLAQEQDFQLSSNKQALYFYAPWMPFHKRMLIMIGKTEEKHKNIGFTAIDANNFGSLCRRFNVDSIPTILIMDNGKEINRITGLVLTSAFRSVFADICNS